MTLARKIIVWLIFAIIGVLVWMVYAASSNGAEIKAKSQCEGCPRTIIVTEPLTPGKVTVFYRSTNLTDWVRTTNLGVDGTNAYTQTGMKEPQVFFISETH